MTTKRPPIGDTLTVEYLGVLGPHRVLDSAYVETFWLPVIGPGSFVLARRLCRVLTMRDYRTVVLDVRQLAQEVGMPGGPNGGQPNSLIRCLYRLCSFGVAEYDGDRYWIAQLWPTLTENQSRRLPEPLRSLAQPPARSAVSVTRSPLVS